MLKLHCTQCGARFSGRASGSGTNNLKMKAHMDWHFRQNRRAKDKDRKAAVSRGWYLLEESWVAEKEADEQDIAC